MHPLKSHNEEEEILKLLFCITAEYIYNLHIVVRITCNTEIKDKLAILRKMQIFEKYQFVKVLLILLVEYI